MPQLSQDGGRKLAVRHTLHACTMHARTRARALVHRYAERPSLAEHLAESEAEDLIADQFFVSILPQSPTLSLRACCMVYACGPGSGGLQP